MNKFAVLSVLGIFLLAGCMHEVYPDNNGDTDVPEQGYTNLEHGFSFTPPEGWNEFDLSGFGVIQSWTGPTEGQFQINMNVGVQDLPITIDLSEYLPELKQELKNLLEGYSVIDETSTTINGLPAVTLTSTFLLSSQTIQNKQYYITKNNKVYIFTLTTNPELFDKYESVFDTSIQTFKIIE